MAQATLLSRIAVGACGALIIGTAALAQTPPPASAPPAQAPAAPAAPQFPPTATITTPGYPAVGPADSKLRVVRFTERQEGASAAGNARNHAMGLVRQFPAASAARPFRRHHRDGNDDAQSQSGGSGHHHRANQEVAHRFPRPRAAYIDGSDLYRGSATGRRAQGQAEQNRPAGLRDELQRAGHVRPVSERLSGRPSQILVSRSR